MNSLNQRRLSLLLIMVLFFASVQSIFAGQIKNNDRAMHHLPVAAHVGELALVSKQSGDNDNHRHRSTTSMDMNMESTVLCADSTCTHCAHCVSFISVPRVANDKKIKPVLNFVVTTPVPYLELPTKDRPPRNA